MTLNNKTEEKAEKSNRKRILLIIICIFLSIVLIFGITLGIIIGVKNANALFSYEGTTLDGGEAMFFASYYKYRFIAEYASHGAEDASSFWSSKYDGDTTYGELLERKTEEYLRNVTVANYLFNKFATLTDEDERKIKVAIKEVLDYKADGSEEKFNSLVSEYGFDYDSFSDAVEILYKTVFVKDAIYGEDGKNMLSFSEECNRYFDTYSRVKLLFIRTENKFLLDANGNRVIGEDGNDTLISLTDSEKARRAETISEIREAIRAYEENTDNQMSPTYFNLLLSEHDEGDASKRSKGYYFSPESAYTKEFSEEFSDIVEKALSMEKESYAEVNFDGGVCFIYKCENEAVAYLDNTDGSCFADFLPLAANASFDRAVNEIAPEVKVSDKFSGIDLTELPYNYIFIPRF